MESYKTLKTLNLFLKIFSLHNISCCKEMFFVNPWPYLRVFIMLICFGSLSAYNLYIHYTSTHFTAASPSVVITDTARAALGYFEYIVDLSFVYNFGHQMCDYFIVYDHMDKAIAMKYYNKIRHSVIVLLGFFTSSWLMVSLGEYMVWGNMIGWKSPSTYIANYFMFLVRILTVMDMNSQILQIKYRLKTMTDTIQEYASFADDSPSCLKTLCYKRRNDNKQNEPTYILESRNEIGKLNSYYLLLNEQTTFLNKYFGVRMLLYCLYTLEELITFVNIMARLATRSTMLFTNYLPISTSFLRFFNCTAVVVSLVYYCETCCQQCGVVVDAVDKVLVNKNLDDDLRSSLTMLRLLVSTRPLRFHAAGFFSLDSTLLLSIASVVLTYAVVIIESVP